MLRMLSLLLVATTLQAQSAEWEQSLASTASLRTGGARLVSSDALRTDDGQTALITYWESPLDADDHAVYRCVDIVGIDFAPRKQACWKVLEPAARRPSEPG